MLFHFRYRYDLSVEEAAELARRAIYHATFRDGASGGVASGMFLASSSLKRGSTILSGYFRSICCIFAPWCLCIWSLTLWFVSVYHVGPNGWKKLSGDDVGELHYNYYPVEVAAVEQEMAEVPVA